MHGSDAQGPIDDNARDWIIKENPDLAVIDGSIIYMLGFRLSWKNFLHGLENLVTILRESDRLKKVIYDHHLVRDLYYKEKLSKNPEVSNEIGKKIVTVMEFLGGKNNFLEANRKKLYEEFPSERP